MGYWGTIVVARPDGLLAHQDAVSGFGYRHRWLRELGGGWQLLETSGWDDPPDLTRPCAALAIESGFPALAAYVSDSDCAVACTATPNGVGPLTHLWNVTGPCGDYRHVPCEQPEPAGRTVDGVVSELLGWAAAGDLSPEADRVRAIISHDQEQHWTNIVDLVFDLVTALGAQRIGRTLPWTFPVDRRPFTLITGSLGLGKMARCRAAYRDYALRLDEQSEPEQAWEAEAIRLEDDLWAALYRPDVDVAELVRRVQWVTAAYDAADAGLPAPPSELVRDGVVLTHPRHLQRTLYGGLNAGNLQPDIFDARRWADERATPDDNQG